MNRRVVPLSFLFVGSMTVALSFKSPVHADSICPVGSSYDNYTFSCVATDKGMPVGYGNPPAHQPTRCEKLDPVPVLDGKGNKIPIPGSVPEAFETKRYSNLVAEPVDLYMDAPPTVSPPVGVPDFSQPGTGAVDNRVTNSEAEWAKYFVDGGVVDVRPDRHQYQLFGSYCSVPGNQDDFLHGSEMRGWVKVVSNENMVEDLMVEVTARLTNVNMTWPTVSPKHGWQMVKVPLEIRGVVPGSVSRSMSAANLTRPQGLTVSITASPSKVMFYSGDRDYAVTCPVEQLSWDVPDPEHPTACSYTYRHSSVQREGRPFETQVVTVWNVVTPDPALNRPWRLPAVRKDLLVAETQALVTG